MPCSSSAFCTFQHGCPASLTHSLRQRWSLMATFPPIENLRRSYRARKPCRDEDDRPTIVAVTHPDGREAVAQEIAAALAEDRPFAVEYRIMQADGGIPGCSSTGVKT